MPDQRTRILFLCTGNRARSIMAEGIANGIFSDRLEARSAGSRPKPPPHWRAIELLRQHGVRTDQLRSKSVDEAVDGPLDAAVTLCDAAAQDLCPVLPGATLSAHWSLPDPADVEDEALIFEQTFHALMEAIGILAAETGPLRARLDSAKEVIEARLVAFR